MKNKTLSFFLCLIILFCAIQPTVHAANYNDTELTPQFTNISNSICSLDFIGENGQITARVIGSSGTYVDAYLKLYEIQATTMVLISSWEMHSNQMAIFSKKFQGISGKTYYVILEATVASDTYIEPITVTDTKVCL